MERWSRSSLWWAPLLLAALIAGVGGYTYRTLANAMRDNIAKVAKSGVDLIVTGSAVYDGKAPVENAKFMMDAVRSQAE